ncbi:hypothetical protein U9M48_022522 [Paspalum notatum var. saurae]|uniref:PHD-type zinc finger plants domain-containing protein n=1 Tax=Paspalum notatum var. saurae TaxID=547442 RepID=A0AAQ3THW8_PASNO
MDGGATVCSMCGDVGFPDKLFRCARCRRRFQHSYCTNYYGEAGAGGVCDWCLSVGVGGGKNKRQYYSSASAGYSSKQQQVEEEEGRGARQAAAFGPPPSGCSKGAGKVVVTGTDHEGGGRRPRRYKLLKDVLC